MVPGKVFTHPHSCNKTKKKTFKKTIEKWSAIVKKRLKMLIKNIPLLKIEGNCLGTCLSIKVKLTQN